MTCGPCTSSSPSSPVPRSLPSGERTLARVPGARNPTVSGASSASCTFCKHTMGEHSERPYPSVTTIPSLSLTCLASSCDSVAAPDATCFLLETSYFSTSGLLASASTAMERDQRSVQRPETSTPYSQIGGTTKAKVALCSCTSSKNVSNLKRERTTRGVAV